MFASGSNIKAFATRLVSDEDGQELIEYAILTAFIATGTVLLFAALATTMNAAYAAPTTGFNDATQNVWEPCAPNGGACP